ncbi:MAG TPA: hypothetical protein VH394_28940 [Thermoanaerobaculia bacterium]|nr:hypothetical protein [Thermoanaerobaculia bacterium]
MSLGEALLRLPREHQNRLPILGLFEAGLVDLNVLAGLEEATGIGRDAWEETTEAAVRAGLLIPAMESVYRMESGLAEILEGAWQDRAEEREAVQAALLRSWAVVGEWLGDQLGEEDDEIAMEVLDLEAEALGAAAASALDRRMFGEALSILEPLNTWWVRTGSGEAPAWTAHARQAVGEPETDSEAGALWFFLVGAEASRLHRADALDEAEARYHLLRERLERADSDWARIRLAATYHQLSILAHRKGDAPAAAEWHRKAEEAAA